MDEGASNTSASAPRSSSSARPKRSFPFPGTPYDIQVEFMNALYDLMEAGGVGIFESPTGTGKTLSIICATLQWLRDHENDGAIGADYAGPTALAPAAPPPEVPPAASDEPSWLAEWKPAPRKTKAALRREARLAAMRERRDSSRRPLAEEALHPGARRGGEGSSREGPGAGEGGGDGDSEDELLVEEVEEGGTGRRRAREESDGEESGGEDEEDGHLLKVYYCSRTHSQLSQFLAELRRATPSGGICAVPLASRKQLCVNGAVRALGSLERINQRCLDLADKKRAARKTADETKSGAGAEREEMGPVSAKAGKGKGKGKGGSGSGGCEMRSAGRERALGDELLDGLLDIEELARRGAAARACPYYATRAALPSAHVVAVPYSALLQRSTREALGIRLRGCVLLIDEAHNLQEAVNSAHGARLSGGQLLEAAAQLDAYLQRFISRLAPASLRRIQETAVALRALARLLGIEPQLVARLAPEAIPGPLPRRRRLRRLRRGGWAGAGAGGAGRRKCWV
eukprot:tig00001154_g7266.t1